MLKCVLMRMGNSAFAVHTICTIALQDSEDLIVRDTSDPYKVAGAIAGRLREGERVGLLTKGPEGVFISVQAIAMARVYCEEDKFDIKFAPKRVEVQWDRLVLHRIRRLPPSFSARSLLVLCCSRNPSAYAPYQLCV